MNSDEKLPLSAFMPHHPSSDQNASFIATAGKKNNISIRLIDKSEIIESLKTIHDPELPVNIYDLGLIYDIELIDKNNLKVKMSLTAPGCPVAGEIPGQVANTLAKIPNIGLIEVELVWDPVWTKDRMSEDAKLALDIY